MQTVPEPDLGHMIAHCGHLSRQYSVNLLQRRGYDVTPVQTRTLVYLSCCREDLEVNQRDLERELGLRPSTVNGIVGRLEEKGYIVRRASPTDGRCRMVDLTEAGREKVGEFRAALEETERRLLSGLSGEEQGRLRALLARVIANLENEVNHS